MPILPATFPVPLTGLPPTQPLDGAPYDPIFDHGGDAVELLLWQFRGKPRIEATLRALVRPYSRVENALWQMLTRVIPVDEAEGEALNLWGRILRVPRRGLDDGDYRVRLRVRMRALRSSGRVEDLYDVIRLALGQSVDVTILEAYPATMIVDIADPLGDAAWLRAELFVAIKGGGVRLLFTSNPGDDAELFTWDDGSGADGATLGWGSTLDSDLGGVWSSARLVR